MKILDIDQLFSAYLIDYVKNNPTENESEVAAKMAELYADFGKQPLSELDGKSPEEYYNMQDGTTLCNALLTHVEKDIPVPDYLYSAILNKTNEEELIALLDNNNEEIVSYAVNLLGEKGSEKAFKKYVTMLATKSVSEDILDGVTELICKNPDLVSEEIINLTYDADDNDKLYYLEILSRCKHDDRIFKFITDEFIRHPSQIQLYLSYVTRYGDERVLPILYKVIEEPFINYVDFKELQLSIESLGGKYDKQRDFSQDVYYKKLHDTSKS